MDFVKQSCEEFVAMLASKAPVPGGGGASALAGAIGVALGNMVGALTLGKEKYAQVQDDIAALNARATRLREELLAFVQKDAEAFEPLARAYGMPKGSDAERADKARVTEAALREACGVPLSIMEKCGEAIELHAGFLEKGAAIAVSDVGVGVLLCKAALQGAALNVRINTKSMTDRAYAEKLNQRTETLIREYAGLADRIYADVFARL
ncbi:MAG: cyclodeaminase/cyclohydrolase family protein [Clostridiales Family XIII bacterium]|jgi:formiminotetrahydrofolate cyclodeaminase|nr:cyclodeaminase/cyclohydrolase family protein [Clostridiales Family XIII bacterium]